MTDCTSIRPILSLFASDDLDVARRASVEAHLAGCAACSSEAADINGFIDSIRASLAVEATLPLGVVTRVSSRAAEEALRTPWWMRLLPPIPVHGWGAAVPAMVLAAVVAAPFVLNHEGARPQAQAPVRLDMQVEGDGVRVAWSNGHNRTYKVYKTTDPRMLGSGPGQVVRGHEWVDRNPGSSTIVYYRVE